jgi:hypothetical protein
MSIKACVVQIYSLDAILKNKFSTFKEAYWLLIYNEVFILLNFK